MTFDFPYCPASEDAVAAQEAGRGQLTPIDQKDIPYHLMSCSTIKTGDTYTAFVLNDNLFLLLLFQIFLPSTADKEWETEQKLSCHLETTHHNHKFKDCKQRKMLLKKKKEKIQSFFWCLLWYLNNFHECERRSYKVLVCLCDVKDAEYWRNISTLCPCWKETVLDNKSQTQ